MVSDLMQTLEDTLQEDLDFLAGVGSEIAYWQGRCKRLPYERKHIVAQCFCTEEGGVKEREMKAEAGKAYKDNLEATEEAEAQLKLLQVQVAAKQARIEVWRSLNSRAGKGHV